MKLYNYLDLFEVEKTNIKNFNIEISGVTSKSCKVVENNVFIALKGEKHNGNNFIAEAKKNGASLVISGEFSEKLNGLGIPYIIVNNPRRVLAKTCARSYGNPEKAMKITGVTGTNGKTGTVKLLCGIYSSAQKKYKDFGTIYGGLTTPDSEDFFKEIKRSFDEGKQHVLMEVSSHSLFYDKLYGVKFACGVFTNLSRDHLDFHKTMEDYCVAKSKLFTQSDIGLLNYDDEYCEKISEYSASKNFYYSIENKKADFYAENINYLGENGIEYCLCSPFERIKIKSRLLGKINVYNTLAAASCALLNGIEPEYIYRGIENTVKVNGRMEKLPLEKYGVNVYIDYAHTPDALKKSLSAIRETEGEKKSIVLVFGCGGNRDKGKRKIMGEIASKFADKVVITSDNPRFEEKEAIIEDILTGIDKNKPYKVITERQKAIEETVFNAKENEVILLAGKGHEQYEIIKDEKHPFNERIIAEKAALWRYINL